MFHIISMLSLESNPISKTSFYKETSVQNEVTSLVSCWVPIYIKVNEN